MYGIQKVSELTGVSPITLRAWENRYGIIKPDRTDGGTRIYSEQDIEKLNWVIQQKNDKAISIKQAMQLLKDREKREQKNQLNPNNYDWYIDKIYLTLKNHYMDEATNYIDFLVDTLGHEQTFHDFFIPVLTKIGLSWENDDLSVAEEHFMSHYIQQRIAEYFYQLEVKQPKQTAIAVCPTDEMHQIGLLLFSIFLKKQGINVLFIGENTPADSLIDLINKRNINLLAASFTLASSINQLTNLIDTVREAAPNLDIVIGGQNLQLLPEDYQRYQIGHTVAAWKEWLNH
ncbi:B12 binding protein [Streptohalobacillus salinus]|uniref:B12 binding protein n=1 Tax=Streptohalobacillus salinus TaxID=621096 RepID=A0A2V3WCT2_9BACI|nr:MerR family transcriptional regulator [Streptohalobacillus salinus]PXW90891.1 B12 binding protein [Streptohalobacillus salinus]